MGDGHVIEVCHDQLIGQLIAGLVKVEDRDAACERFGVTRVFTRELSDKVPFVGGPGSGRHGGEQCDSHQYHQILA